MYGYKDYPKDGWEYASKLAIRFDEFTAAAREAVEVLENMAHAEDAELRYYRGELARRTELWWQELQASADYYDATVEAVEVLEDLLAHEREAGEGWKLAAADYYGKTLELKAKNRELMSELQSQQGSWKASYFNILRDWHKEKAAKEQNAAALRDAEAKIKELHFALSLAIQNPPIRGGERMKRVNGEPYDAAFYQRWANDWRE